MSVQTGCPAGREEPLRDLGGDLRNLACFGLVLRNEAVDVALRVGDVLQRHADRALAFPILHLVLVGGALRAPAHRFPLILRRDRNCSPPQFLDQCLQLREPVLAQRRGHDGDQTVVLAVSVILQGVEDRLGEDIRMSFHKLDRAKDSSFWSVRVNADIRLIVHRTTSSILLVYVDRHDDAYKWAERRKIERHPTTGAMQLVEVRERIEEVEIIKPKEVEAEGEAPAPATPKPRLFDNLRKFELMAFGVPEEWVNDVRAATEDTLFDIIEHLPQEAQEALLKLAVGERPEPPAPAPAEADPFAHPDAQRRFRVLTNVEELQRALEFPWDKWAVFLHPAQNAVVERTFAGPARISGSAGTGKTIVALHRAVHLARTYPDARILLTTFSKGLANSLKVKLRSLTASEPAIADRIEVKSITTTGYDLFAQHFGQPQIASAALVRSLITKAAAEVEGHSFSGNFLFGEWSDVVDAWQLKSWEDYRDVSRLGRKTRIGGRQREVLWQIFERVRAGLAEKKALTWSDVFGRLTEHLRTGAPRPFEFAVVDEVST